MSHIRTRVALVVGVALLLLVQYRIWLDDSGVFASQALLEEITNLEQDNQALEATNDQYRREVQDLRHGGALLEEKAREDLGLIQDGETFIIFVEPES